MNGVEVNRWMRGALREPIKILLTTYPKNPDEKK